MPLQFWAIALNGRCGLQSRGLEMFSGEGQVVNIIEFAAHLCSPTSSSSPLPSSSSSFYQTFFKCKKKKILACNLYRNKLWAGFGCWARCGQIHVESTPTHQHFHSLSSGCPPSFRPHIPVEAWGWGGRKDSSTESPVRPGSPPRPLLSGRADGNWAKPTQCQIQALSILPCSK